MLWSSRGGGALVRGPWSVDEIYLPTRDDSSWAPNHGSGNLESSPRGSHSQQRQPPGQKRLTGRPENRIRVKGLTTARESLRAAKAVRPIDSAC
jgi:hypothetical protein